MFKKILLLSAFLFLAGCKINSNGWFFIGDRNVDTTPPPTVIVPVLTELQAIGFLFDNNEPEYKFNSTEDGVLSFAGDCTSSDINAVAGDNTITLTALAWDKEYNNCTITLTNADNVSSIPLAISTFQIVKRVTLNDTGVISCGNYGYSAGSVPHDNSLDCYGYLGISFDDEGVDDEGAPIPAGQDMYFGRDWLEQEAGALNHTDGYAGFSFAKTDRDGNPTNDCVQDTVTGLTWENKLVSDAVRGEGVARNWSDALSYVDTINAVNTIGLCGYNDWRVPSREELQSISHRGARGPALDTNFFVATTNIANEYLTSSENKMNGTEMYSINFYDGQVKLIGKTTPLRVRLVRGIY